MRTADSLADIELSVIIALRNHRRIHPIQQLYREYKQHLDETGLRCEFIFVVNSDLTTIIEDLCQLKKQGECIRVLKIAGGYGTATALTAGFEHASGAILLTLPGYHQVDPRAIPALVEALADSDMVLARRWPRADSKLNRLQTRFFHFVLKKIVGAPFRDLACSVRVMKKKVVDTVQMYGDQHRFFPIFANRYGFRVKEIDVPQSSDDAFPRYFSVGVYIRRLLDLLSIFFLVKFTAKPLRFFGLPGLFIFVIGAVFTVYLAVQRMFMGVALADRPVLLLGLLLIVLGIQLFAFGLIGELIIFIHAKKLKEYMIETIVNE